MTIHDVWGCRADLGSPSEQANLIGYDAEALDGRIGTIEEASMDTDHQYLVVDTAFWTFGKKRLIPAGMVGRVDHAHGTTYVSMTKDQIQNAPDFDHAEHDDHERQSAYYQHYCA